MGSLRRLFGISGLLIGLHIAPIDSFTHVDTLKCKRITRTCGAKPPTASDEYDDDVTRPSSSVSQIRRQVLLSSFTSSLVLSQFPQVSSAGEVGARINAAVTKSDLGIAVRESVVRGAQTMDKVDGKWEAFSDKFGLGAARKQQDGKPVPKDIPDPLPLDTTLAKRILETSDQVRTCSACG